VRHRLAALPVLRKAQNTSQTPTLRWSYQKLFKLFNGDWYESISDSFYLISFLIPDGPRARPGLFYGETAWTGREPVQAAGLTYGADQSFMADTASYSASMSFWVWPMLDLEVARLTITFTTMARMKAGSSS